MGDRETPKRLGERASGGPPRSDLPTVPAGVSGDRTLPELLRREAVADGVERFVVGAVIHDGGLALVVTRSGSDDFLAGIEELPSGGVDPGETLADALRRELAEEVGFCPGEFDDGFLATFDYVSGSGRRTRQFTVSASRGEHRVELSDEHVFARWVGPDDLGASTATPETKRVLEAWFAWNGGRG